MRLLRSIFAMSLSTSEDIEESLRRLVSDQFLNDREAGAFVRRGAGKELQIRLSAIVGLRPPETDSRPEAHLRCFLCTRPFTEVSRSQNATHTIGF